MEDSKMKATPFLKNNTIPNLKYLMENIIKIENIYKTIEEIIKESYSKLKNLKVVFENTLKESQENDVIKDSIFTKVLNGLEEFHNNKGIFKMIKELDD